MGRDVLAGTGRVQVNPLAWVRYAIGGNINEVPDRVTMYGYGAVHSPSAKYINLYSEDGEVPEYGPYLPRTRTASEYEEGVPDPNRMGFWRNLDDQLYRAVTGKARWVETDNRDAYLNSVVLKVFDTVAARGLQVICKNPGMSDHDEDSTELLRHSAVVSSIIEKGDVTPGEFHLMRAEAGKPEMPVTFVSFGDGRAWAERVAEEIFTHRYVNMGVTYDRAANEYGGEIEDILKPLPSVFEPNATFPSLGISMPEIPAHLALARTLVGTDEYAGGNDNAKILSFAKEIGRRFPDMAAYCAQYNHDEIPWCGLFAGYCMAMSGIRPVFGPTDTDKFLWAQAWKQFGTPTFVPQLGDILVFARHVTFYNGEDGSSYLCLGGNQSDSVTITRFSKSSCEAIRRPPVAGVQPTAAPRLAVSNFDKCLALTLKEEGGNDDDPRDPGGRTSRGITAERWNEWRQTHPGLPADVWDAPQAEVVAIYREKYWDVMSCDDLPSGVDLAVFDFGVNSGPARSARYLQNIVIPSEVDGEIGPNTIAATAQADPRTVAAQICDDRLAFLQGLGTWPTFGNGWSARVRRMRIASLEMAATPKGNPMPKATEPQIFLPGTPLPGQIDPQQLARVVTEAVQAAMPQIIAAVRQGLGPIALPPVAQPAQPAPPAVDPPPDTTASTVAKNAAGGLLGLLATFATWYNGGISDVTAINTGLGAIAGGALSAYSPLINLGLRLFSRVSLK